MEPLLPRKREIAVRYQTTLSGEILLREYRVAANAFDECSRLACLALAQVAQQLGSLSGQHNVRWTVSLNLTGVDYQHIRRGLESFRDIMRDIERGNLAVGEPRRQPFQNGNLQIGVEAGEGLVQQQQARPGSERASQRHALFLPTGKVGRRSIGELAGVKEVEHFGDPLGRRFTA